MIMQQRIHWELCKKHTLERRERWYYYIPDGTAENIDVELLWDINLQCYHAIEARHPDIVIIDKRGQSGIILDIAVPTNGRVHEKEREKVEKYQELRREIGRLWQLKNVKVVPVVVGALGSVTKDFDN